MAAPAGSPLGPLVDRWPAELLPTFPGRLVVPPGLRAFVVAGIAARAGGPVLAVVPGERDAEELIDDVALFWDDVVALPAWETLPFEHVSPNVTTMALRARARHRLAAGAAGTVVVASVRSVVQRLSPSPVTPVGVVPGEDVERDDLIAQLSEYGYHRTDRVEARGEFAVRGGIVDVFPAQGDDPVRLEFWGDTVEEARVFEISTQRSVDAVDRLVAYPAREFRADGAVRERARAYVDTEAWAAETWDRFAEGLQFAGMESWLPWLAEERSLLDEAGPAWSTIVFDPARARDRSRELVKEESELAAALATTWGRGAPEAGGPPPRSPRR